MDEKESYLAKLDRVGKEMEEKLSPKEWVKSRLYWEDWESLLGELVSFAKQEIRRRRWRGGRSGVLPEGCDANSVAAEVIGVPVHDILGDSYLDNLGSLRPEREFFRFSIQCNNDAHTGASWLRIWLIR